MTLWQARRMSEVTVADNPEQSRYEVIVDGAVAGFAAYVRHPDHLTFTHTEIGSDYGGQGLGGTLVSGALADVRASGGRIVASCPFVKSYVEKHPEYQDLLKG
jgi:predicted GNAT family acetyltransferase